MVKEIIWQLQQRVCFIKYNFSAAESNLFRLTDLFALFTVCLYLVYLVFICKRPHFIKKLEDRVFLLNAAGV